MAIFRTGWSARHRSGGQARGMLADKACGPETRSIITSARSGPQRISIDRSRCIACGAGMPGDEHSTSPAPVSRAS